VVDSDWGADWDNISLSPAQQRGMDQSRALLLEAAAQGHMDAHLVCGDIYCFGQGVAKDEHLRFVYHEKAAGQGHMLSQFNMGVSYQIGDGCEQSYERAAEWYKKAAGQGHAPAMVSLGGLYHAGQGVPQNPERAFELYQQSRALGNTDPGLHHNLGACYEFGGGVTKDYLEARRLYSLASAQGRRRHRRTEPTRPETPQRVPAPRQAGGDHGHEPRGPERPGRDGDLLRPR